MAADLHPRRGAPHAVGVVDDRGRQPQHPALKGVEHLEGRRGGGRGRLEGGHALRAVCSIGSQTWNVVPCGPESKLSDPRWRSSTIRRAVSRPRPVPWPTSFVVKNGSKTCSCDVGRDPRAVVGDVDDDALAVAPRAHRDRALVAERVDRVVEQVRPHLVELGAADGQLRQRAVVVAADLDPRVLELVAEHDQRRLQPLVHVDLDELAAVHVGVGLDRADQRAHALGRTRPARRARPRAVSDAATQRTTPGRRRPGQRVRAVQPRPVDPGGGQRLGERHGSGTPSSSRRSSISSSASAASSASSASPSAARGERLALQRDQLLGLLALDARLDERARSSCRPRRAPRPARPPRAGPRPPGC